MSLVRIVPIAAGDDWMLGDDEDVVLDGVDDEDAFVALDFVSAEVSFVSAPLSSVLLLLAIWNHSNSRSVNNF